MNNLPRYLIWSALLGIVIFGGVRCIGFLQNDSIRATEDLRRGVQK